MNDLLATNREKETSPSLPAGIRGEGEMIYEPQTA